ncbi:hypothetical protein [Streptomyces sp. adm13(2018)]|uniref:hypothetical protein n=1 Tax=Streptomyces sp. adm13(2018) TaxID=2479007 RepID=UPI0011CE89EE|nr:hypothetical protein [Streptomyces sp. adm13(2018)]
MDDYERRAAIHRLAASRHKLIAAVHEASAAFVGLAKAMREAHAHIDASAAREVATHPDLAELNVQLDGYYGKTTDG